MEGIDKIVSAILREGQEAADQKIREAQEEAAGIRRQAQKQADDSDRELLEDAKAKARAMSKIAVSAGEQSVKQAMLQARLDVMEQVLVQTRKKLFDTEDYDGLFFNLLTKYGKPLDGVMKMSALDAGRLSRDFEKRVKKQFGKALELKTDETMPEGGFVLVYGEMEENCLFDALIESRREELLDAIYPVLFSQQAE